MYKVGVGKDFEEIKDYKRRGGGEGGGERREEGGEGKGLERGVELRR